MRKGFAGLTEVAALDDAAALSLVLGNWHKLNRVLQSRPSVDELRRLLYLELRRGGKARSNFVLRLRRAIAGAASRVARDAVTAVVMALHSGESPEEDDLVALGLDRARAKKLIREVA